MALGNKLCLLSALLLLFASTYNVNAQSEDDDEVTVETVEEEKEEHYESPRINPNKVYLAEHFDDEVAFKKKWIKSEAKKKDVDETIAKYDGNWEIQAPSRKILKNDFGLVLTTEAKHAAIASLLDKPFEFRDKPLIVQYEVTMQEGQNCGGAYIKLLSRGTNTKADLRKFHDQTPYTVMFGPDKCGNDNKLHFIFRHRNPKNGSIEEKHSKKPSARLDEIYKDKEPHLYTLIIRPDNSFSVLVDNKVVNEGSLLEDFTPPVNPPEEIDDPNDTKPDDWDEKEKIVDPSASKPADWDDDAPAQIVDPNAVRPDGWLEDVDEMIPDPDAKKPLDWDEDMDGSWEAPLIDNPLCSAAPGCGKWKPPLISNPNYKGIWRAPLINNPNYKGKWIPRKIHNPDYFYDDHPFQMTPIHAVGFELWSMSPQLLFDNLIVTDDLQVAADWARQTYDLKRAKISRDSRSLWGRLERALNHAVGWWALYAAYVAVPVAAYVAYLLRQAGQESILERSLKFAGENPWVYAVVIVVAFLFVGLFAYLCCTGSKDTELDKKKTDEETEDDPRASGDEGEDGEDAEPPRGKAGLEAAPEEPDSSETATPIDTDGAGDGQRKRKPRKE